MDLPHKADHNPTAEHLATIYALDDNYLPVDRFPMTYSVLMKHQEKDKHLIKFFKSSKDLIMLYVIHVRQLTLKQHYTLPNIRKDVQKVYSKCATCVLTKRNKKRNYGLLPEKKVESEPWKILCIDLLSQYSIPTKKKRNQEEA